MSAPLAFSIFDQQCSIDFLIAKSDPQIEN